jgi:hypothetical protein
MKSFLIEAIQTSSFASPLFSYFACLTGIGNQFSSNQLAEMCSENTKYTPTTRSSSRKRGTTTKTLVRKVKSCESRKLFLRRTIVHTNSNIKRVEKVVFAKSKLNNAKLFYSFYTFFFQCCQCRLHINYCFSRFHPLLFFVLSLDDDGIGFSSAAYAASFGV